MGEGRGTFLAIVRQVLAKIVNTNKTDINDHTVQVIFLVLEQQVKVNTYHSLNHQVFQGDSSVQHCLPHYSNNIELLVELPLFWNNIIKISGILILINVCCLIHKF